MVDREKESYEQELAYCPVCKENRGEEVPLNADAPEFHGGGVMTRNVGCPDCDWSAVENWEIDNTSVHE